ncbi:MAG: monovalent cation/H(+) antiporter subunit G [Candidatus Promineifilaceae bacterium]
MNLLDGVVLLLYLAGLFFNLAGVVGILRLPDLYCRLHSSSKNTTLGASLVIFGLALRQLQQGSPPAALKILALALLTLAVTPIASHALARAAYKNGSPLAPITVVDQYLERVKED